MLRVRKESPSAWCGGLVAGVQIKEGHWGGLPPGLGFMCSPGK